MSIYTLEFTAKARKAWSKLTAVNKQQFAKRLAERQRNPHVPSARLREMTGICYKVKLRKAGLRLIYRVFDQKLVILVVSVGKRDKEEAYLDAIDQLKRLDDGS